MRARVREIWMHLAYSRRETVLMSKGAEASMGSGVCLCV